MKVPLGVRKGAWTEEEDVLLRKCINNYGVGNWHLVPTRAGLNRCRKSCRLRWVNYLHPHIKRGHFTLDEVDLIIRLHKLLGNRWSLIAGRLPGRTANDVKNYWNTHLHKKMQLEDMKVSKAPEKETVKTKAIKPQPRTLSRINNLSWLLKGTQTTSVDDDGGFVSKKDNSSKPSQTSTSLQPENGISWWKSDDIVDLWEEPIPNIWDEYNIVDLWDTLNVEHELM